SYITQQRARLERRHYVTDAGTLSMWFNFHDGKLQEFIGAYGEDFCLVINGSARFDDAFILPFKDFKDFFTPEFLDDKRRWSGYIRADDEVIRLSPCKQEHERMAHQYRNAFHLLHDAPQPLPKEQDSDEFV
ncbi:MAG TPA: hypothetical protein VNV43_08805, partial [Candidatus Acidoferrales bacterium]|nr:hypothetical protein [Candidatus Acidoferrales bacterium]